MQRTPEHEQPRQPKPGQRPSGQPAARLYQRGRVYWTWYYDAAGAIHRTSTRQTTHAAALASARRIEAEAQGVGVGAVSEPYSVAQALDRLLDTHPWGSQRTLSSHESRAVGIARHLGDTDLALISRERIDRFIRDRRDEVSDHSIAKELVLLRLALKLAVDEQHWTGDTKTLFPRHRANYRPRERWLTPPEAGALVADLRPHRALWLQVALYTGARFDEVNELAWPDVDLAADLIRIRGTKTDAADRVIPLAPELRAILEPIARASGLVVDRWIQAGRDIKRACQRIEKRERAKQRDAGEPETARFLPATPNDLRRTTASWMVQRGVPPKVIADWLGHKSLDMVMRVYARLNPEAMRPAAASLPRLPGTDASPAEASPLSCQPAAPDCETFVQALCGSTGLERLKRESSPPVSEGSSQWACRDSNAGPLASEANAQRVTGRVKRGQGKPGGVKHLCKDRNGGGAGAACACDGGPHAVH